jgi:hypothetical protein
MSLVPLYGFVAGDTLGVLVLVRDDETIEILAQRLAQAASVRVPPPASTIVVAHGRPLAPHLTVAAAGLTALDRVDLVAEAPS